MPSKKSAIKELKKSKKKQVHNTSLKKAYKVEEKKMNSLLAAKDITKLNTDISGFVSKIDKAVTQKLMHKNKASRKKAQLLKKVHQLSSTKSS
ncbi:MAG: 30S ribosomal protein S20 [Candidatus Omnitrophica bacterium]|nr:30S ribosomal protein S20 [Candidatus Omnitrophota bacterium]